MAGYNISSKNNVESKRSSYIFLLVAGILSIVAITLLVVGIVLYQKSSQECSGIPKAQIPKNSGNLNQQQQKLLDFMKKVKKQYFQLNHNEYLLDPEGNDEDILHHFAPYDPSSESIKKRTDKAMELEDELKSMKLRRSMLRPREKKGLAQVEHFLYSVFGKPYDENYYAGDWMMGPNYFCWQAICGLNNEFRFLSGAPFVPKTSDDLERNINLMKKFKTTVEVYMENMKNGVKAGMVRAVEDCRSGFNAFKLRFPKILEKGPKG